MQQQEQYVVVCSIAGRFLNVSWIQNRQQSPSKRGAQSRRRRRTLGQRGEFCKETSPQKQFCAQCTVMPEFLLKTLLESSLPIFMAITSSLKFLYILADLAHCAPLHQLAFRLVILQHCCACYVWLSTLYEIRVSYILKNARGCGSENVHIGAKGLLFLILPSQSRTGRSLFVTCDT